MLEIIILTVIPDLTQNEFATLLPLVSPKKQERIKRFHFFCDSQNGLLVDILARNEICRITKLTNNQHQFSVNEYGEPFLVNDPHINYNISHAGHYIACAIFDEPVGIDIEFVKPIDMPIAERFLYRMKLHI